MPENSIDNVAFFSIDNFAQHLNAVRTCFYFSQTLTQYCSQIHMGPLYMERSNLLSYPLVRPAKQPLSREVRPLHQIYLMNCTDISAVLSTRRWSNDFFGAPAGHLH